MRLLSAAVALGLVVSAPALAQGTLRIALAAADVPLTTGQADNGAEGMRFVGYTLYDALVLPVAATGDKPFEVVPGLATSWEADPADRTRWRFKIREGVRFHDGSVFDAAAAAWNLDKLLTDGSPQFDARQAGQGRARIPAVKSWRALDPATLEIVTHEPNAYLPYQIAWVTMSSPAQWEKLGKSWQKFALEPSGTGPWKLEKLVSRERAELVPNRDYWKKEMVPALDRIVLLPMPDVTARIAALRSGQADWIEQPAADSVAVLKKEGFVLATGAHMANWVWTLNRAEGSPFNDIRVRKAVNLAINRPDLAEMVVGLVTPATGFVPPGTEWFGNPSFKVGYDKEQAKRLLQEAGYGPQKPLRFSALITSSDVGVSRGLAMNEAIQQDLAAIGVEVKFEVVEWNTLLNIWRSGSTHESSRGAQAINVGYYLQDPFVAFERHVRSDLVSPKGTNWGMYKDAEMDRLLTQARETFDKKAQDAVLAKIHEKFVDEALFFMIVHDVTPLAHSPKMKGFSHPKSTVAAYDWSRIRMTP